MTPFLSAGTQTLALPRDNVAPVVEGCLIALERCRSLILQIGPEDYARRTEGQSSIGEHARHIVDHFRNVLAGAESGLVNYELRDRGGRLEQAFEYCLETFDDIAEGLRGLPPDLLQRPTQVFQIASLGREPSVFESSFERELAFLSGHTIHHLSTMLLVARLAGLEVSCELGMAFSTIAAQSDGTNKRG